MNILFLFLKSHFISANSADLDEMPHHAAFHLGLHYLPTYPFICLFVLILYVPVNSFQSCRDSSFWVEPVLSRELNVLLKDTMQCLW